MRSICFLLAAAWLNADILGYVVDIPKADTITILHNGKNKNIRLMGIEVLSGFKSGAKHEIALLCLKKDVKVRNYHMDKLGRDVGIVLCEDIDINRQLISKGYALTYQNDRVYRQDMQNAQAQNRGMWKRESLVKQYAPNFVQR